MLHENQWLLGGIMVTCNHCNREFSEDALKEHKKQYIGTIVKEAFDKIMSSDYYKHRPGGRRFVVDICLDSKGIKEYDDICIFRDELGKRIKEWIEQIPQHDVIRKYHDLNQEYTRLGNRVIID